MAAPTAAAAATTATIVIAGTLFRDVHAQRAAVEHGAVELGDGLVGVCIGLHRHERKTPRSPGFAIHDDVRFDDVANFCKTRLKGGRRGFVRKIAHVKSVVHFISRRGSKRFSAQNAEKRVVT
jgi:hypothetical protein